MHPGWRRCSSFKYSRYSQSSRLASRAPRPSRCDAGLPPRAASTTLLDPEVDIRQFLHGAEIVRPRDEEVGRQNLGDHRADDRQRRLMRAASLAFALQPRVGERGEDDVALPARPGPALEVIE